MTTTTEVPMEACRLDVSMSLLAAGEGETAAAEGEPKKRGFSGKANSGGIFDHFYYGKLALDMKSLKINRQDLPVLRDHWSNAICGHTSKVTKGDDGISVEGTLFDVTDAGREMLALMEAGFPTQMSVWVPPGRIQRLAEGEEAKVNGQTMTGPGAIYYDATLREVTLTSLGADENTSASLLSAGQPKRSHTALLMGGESMTTETEATPLSAALLKEQHEGVYNEVFRAGVEHEKNRVSALNGWADMVEPEVLKAAIDSGDTVESALPKLQASVAARRDADLKAARLEALRGEKGESLGVDDPEAAEFVESTKKDDAKAKFSELPDGEEKWKAEYAEHGDGKLSAAELQEEFETEEDYLAHKNNPSRKRGGK